MDLKNSFRIMLAVLECTWNNLYTCYISFYGELILNPSLHADTLSAGYLFGRAFKRGFPLFTPSCLLSHQAPWLHKPSPKKVHVKSLTIDPFQQRFSTFEWTPYAGCGQGAA